MRLRLVHYWLFTIAFLVMSILAAKSEAFGEVLPEISVSENAVAYRTQASNNLNPSETVDLETEGILSQGNGTDDTTLYSGVNGDLDWRITKDGTLYVSGIGNYEQISVNGKTVFYSAAWLEHADLIVNAKINIQAITSMKDMFSGCKKLESVDFMNTEFDLVSDMSGMFEGCEKIESLNLINLDTSSVITMERMFSGCSGLKYLDLSGINTSQVRSMKQMFSGCAVLSTLAYKPNTASVRDMSQMFSGCRMLVSLKTSDWNTANVENMTGLFQGCNGAYSIDVSGFDTGKVTDMSSMFAGCSNVTELDVKSFDTSNVKNMQSMFSGCQEIKKLDVIGFHTEKVESMASMFSGCRKLAELDVSGFSVEHVKSMESMFSYCERLEVIDTSHFTPSLLQSTKGMFSGCISVAELDLSKVNFQNVENMDNMFFSCLALSKLELGDFQTDQLTSLNSIFEDCENLKKLDLEKINTSKVYQLSKTFKNCKNLETLTWKHLETQQMISLTNVFYGCAKLNQLDLAGVKTDNATDLTGLFCGCESIKELDVSGFNTSKVKMMTSMFCDCKSLKKIDISKFSSDSLVAIGEMFSGCRQLTEIDVSPLKNGKIRAIMSLFKGCESLKSVDISMLNTADVKSTASLFYGCKSLTEIKMCNTSAVTNMSSMFAGCSSCQEFPLSSMDSGNVEKISGLFQDCSMMREVDLSIFAGCDLASFTSLFEGCTTLRKINGMRALSSSHPDSLSNMFRNCKSLTFIDLSSVNMSDVKNMIGMCQGCNSLTSIDLGTGRTPNLMYFDCAFEDCTCLKSIQIDRITCEKVIDSSIKKLFKGCRNLVAVTLNDSVLQNLLQAKQENFTGCEFFSDIYYSGSMEQWESTKGLVEKASENKLRFVAYHLPDESVHQSLAHYVDFKYPATGGFASKEIKSSIYHADLSVFFGNSYFYDHERTKLSIRASLAGMATGTPINSDHITSMMRNMGFSNLYVHYPETDYYTIGYAIGCRRIYYKNQKRTLVMMVIRGGGYEKEWGGNVYVGLMGDHAGFQIAAEDALGGLQQYVSSLRERGFATDDDLALWVSGYSRGAATANLMGAALDQGYWTTGVREAIETKICPQNIFTFCFECPQGTVETYRKDKEFDNIVNIINLRDFVTKVAMDYGLTWRFGRYGHDYVLPDAANTSNGRYVLQEYLMESKYEGQAPKFDKDLSETVSFFVKQIAGNISRPIYAENMQIWAMPLAAEHKSILALFESDETKNEKIVKEELKKSKDSFVAAHYPELCMAWIDALTPEDILCDKDYIRLYVNCPVDIYVYTEKNELSGQIIGNKVVEMEGVITKVDANGQKILVLPKDDIYKVILNATDSGSMTISSTYFRNAESIPNRVEVYENLSLSKGDQYIYFSDKRTENLSVNGNIITPSISQNGNDVKIYTVSVTEEGNGKAYGAGVYVAGEYCKLVAEPKEGEKFLGWFRESEMLSNELELRLCITENNEILAKFTTDIGNGKNDLNVTDLELLQFKKGGIVYLANHKGEAKVYSIAKPKKVVKIPGSVNYKGRSYKVVEICEKAFAKNRKLKVLLIGRNIRKINKKAFYKCRNLRRIKISSRKIIRIHKDAFRGIGKNVNIICPNGRRKKYKKMVLQAGALRTVHFK